MQILIDDVSKFGAFSNGKPIMPTSSLHATDMVLQVLRHAEAAYDLYIGPTLPSPVNAIVSTVFSSTFGVIPYAAVMVDYAGQHLTKLLSSNGGSAEGSALISSLVLLLTLYVAFKTLNYIRRSIFGWVMLAVKLCVVLTVLQALIYINTYGWEKTTRDATWIGGMVYSFVEDAIQDSSSDDKVARGMGTRKSTNVKTGAGRSRWT